MAFHTFTKRRIPPPSVLCLWFVIVSIASVENVLIINIKVNEMPKHHPCSKTTDKKTRGPGGGASHKRDFNFEMLISEIEDYHTDEHV